MRSSPRAVQRLKRDALAHQKSQIGADESRLNDCPSRVTADVEATERASSRWTVAAPVTGRSNHTRAGRPVLSISSTDVTQERPGYRDGLAESNCLYDRG